MRTVIFALVACLLVRAAPIRCQQPDVTPAVTAYREFRRWLLQQPDELREREDTAVKQAYRAYLGQLGRTESEIESTIVLLNDGSVDLEVEFWNERLTASEPTFNTEPNAFLVRAASALEPGRALDVGMGQGRNAIWLARQGWDVTGFDPADQAVALARRLAEEAGVGITTEVAGAEDFSWGREEWDLVVLSYVTARPLIGTIREALRPGGHVVLEAYHVDSTAGASIGRGVVYDSNELLELFSDFRILHYEDTVGVSDFGLQTRRLVRILAMKE